MRQLALSFIKLQKTNAALAHHGYTSNKTYVVSEALYYLLGGYSSTLTPMFIELPGVKTKRDQHWWLIDRRGNVYDLFSNENEQPIPYANGKRAHFRGTGPSGKARMLMNDILQECS